ncbi:MAG TPA: response regulator transcription factor [Phenylobacterium sp.]|uniref:response regulator transcription factor n=1 Tax=Phenylobacterium sp. TaxID=1871053 RepID=UPI002B470FC5|nr:response regulator transcription factor [Phenylobacterium sp.]HKR88163.1 response regulator transcription factor [Phenylobacterium sp.]
MLRILIADDHEIVRKGVRDLIEAHPGWEVCGEAADGQTALEIALREKPEIAVLDVALPVLNGVALTRRLKQESPNTSVLLFTMHDDDETVSSGLAAGARGYVLKTDSERYLEAAISALGANRPYFSSFVSELLLDAAINDRKRSRLESFTIRELEVAQLIAEGNSNKQIARNLEISIKTVESHRSAAMRKAGARTAAEFVRFAIKHNLIQP